MLQLLQCTLLQSDIDIRSLGHMIGLVATVVNLSQSVSVVLAEKNADLNLVSVLEDSLKSSAFFF